MFQPPSFYQQTSYILQTHSYFVPQYSLQNHGYNQYFSPYQQYNFISESILSSTSTEHVSSGAMVGSVKFDSWHLQQLSEIRILVKHAMTQIENMQLSLSKCSNQLNQIQFAMKQKTAQNLETVAEIKPAVKAMKAAGQAAPTAMTPAATVANKMVTPAKKMATPAKKAALVVMKIAKPMKTTPENMATSVLAEKLKAMLMTSISLSVMVYKDFATQGVLDYISSSKQFVSDIMVVMHTFDPGGLRERTKLLWETSLFDSDEGIHFRGFYIPAFQIVLSAAPGGDNSLLNNLLWLLLTGKVQNKFHKTYGNTILKEKYWEPKHEHFLNPRSCLKVWLLALGSIVGIFSSCEMVGEKAASKLLKSRGDYRSSNHNLERKQLCQPKSISNFLSIWEPMVLWSALKEILLTANSEKFEVRVINCLDWCEVDIKFHQFSTRYTNHTFDNNGWPEMLKLKDGLLLLLWRIVFHGMVKKVECLYQIIKSFIPVSKDATLQEFKLLRAKLRLLFFLRSTLGTRSFSRGESCYMPNTHIHNNTIQSST